MGESEMSFGEWINDKIYLAEQRITESLRFKDVGEEWAA